MVRLSKFHILQETSYEKLQSGDQTLSCKYKRGYFCACEVKSGQKWSKMWSKWPKFTTRNEKLNLKSNIKVEIKEATSAHVLQECHHKLLKGDLFEKFLVPKRNQTYTISRNMVISAHVQQKTDSSSQKCCTTGNNHVIQLIIHI